MTPKERPILFSGPMVRALLDGRKTQTRRVVKGPHFQPDAVKPNDGGGVRVFSRGREVQLQRVACPYGVIGDRLWVREAWAPVPATAYRHSEGVQQVVNPDDPYLAAIFAAGWDRSIPKWKPSIHMPRWACRLVLEITEVRVERLLDCSDADAQAEGLQWVTPGMWSVDRSLPIIGDDARQVYFELWDHINGAGAAEANPWVWAVSFRVLSDEERQASIRGGEAS
ncbi:MULTISPECIES: hypothetical protein [Brevundimonas]|uniref:hypothetical protein n=1 Tax=Brevundimonas sp. UBA7507 TaxID=1946137 RepID=UPI00257D7400|nr:MULTISPECIES: hypothetical protein [Brevundimonas]